MSSSTIGTGYIQIVPTTKGIKEKVNSEMSSTGSEGGKSFSSGFSNVIGGLGKVAASAIAVGGAAVGKLVQQSVSAYGDFEQLAGGVETLFGTQGMSLKQYADSVGATVDEVSEKYYSLSNAQREVFANADQAYATAGMSANEYMETVTSFSAALISSLDGDTEKAAKVADQAIIDMSDNANKMGSDIESIQNAYQGFAKQNYTMLDNLKLGYGGTKTEMERLLEDASKLSGVKYDISSLSDVYEAIHVVQENLGIAGTTAKEAATTIQGSAGQMSASWQNLLAGMGNSNANMSELVNQFVSSVATFVGNLTPVIETALSGVANLITELSPVIATELPALLTSVLPELLEAGLQIIEALAEGILSALPQLLPTVIELVSEIGTFIMDNLPMIIEAGLQIILQLASALTDALPTLIPAIYEVVFTIFEYLVNNVDLLIDASIQLMIALAEGLAQAIPIIVQKAPVIIGSLLMALLKAIPKLLEAGKQCIIIIKDGLDNAKDILFNKMTVLIGTLKTKAVSKIKEFIEVGKNIVNGIKDGLAEAWDNLVGWFKEKIDGLKDLAKGVLDINSPSKVFADEVGQYIPSGIAQGIQNGMGVLDKAIDSMALSTVEGSIGVESSIASARYNPSNTATSSADASSILSVLSTYLPQIAQGGNVTIKLEGDAGRLFRMMQTEQRRNTELVGI